MEPLTKNINHRSLEEIEADLNRIREQEIINALREVPTELLAAELERRYSPESIGSCEEDIK